MYTMYDNKTTTFFCTLFTYGVPTGSVRSGEPHCCPHWTLWRHEPLQWGHWGPRCSRPGPDVPGCGAPRPAAPPHLPAGVPPPAPLSRLQYRQSGALHTAEVRTSQTGQTSKLIYNIPKFNKIFSIQQYIISASSLKVWKFSIKYP